LERCRLRHFDSIKTLSLAPVAYHNTTESLKELSIVVRRGAVVIVRVVLMLWCRTPSLVVTVIAMTIVRLRGLAPLTLAVAVLMWISRVGR
jgi:hypothetical protein